MIRRLDLIWAALAVIVIVVIGLVWLGPRWSRNRPPAPPPPAADDSGNSCLKVDFTPKTSVSLANWRAPIAANGSPLPAAAQEDLVVAIEPTTFLAYDYQTRNYLLSYWSDGLQRRLCFVDGQFFFYDYLTGFWDQVAPRYLESGLIDLADINYYLLDPAVINRFRLQASALDDQICGRHLCAVWQAQNVWSQTEVRIRVDKQTRKITDISLLSLPDQAAQIRYYYQPVNINSRPEPARLIEADPENQIDD